MATGDFLAKRRDKEIVYQIYSRLSRVAVPLVVSVAFSFDSENLSEADKEAVRRDSKGAMHFLPRRMIECYLINPVAIAGYVVERAADLEVLVTPHFISSTLVKIAETAKYKIDQWNGNLNDLEWLMRVDAANLIAEACAQVSDHRVTFNKKNDTLSLLQRVKVHNAAQIQDLADYVRSLVDAVA